MATVPEIEGYSDLEQIARGGFGTVYRARQDRHNRVVALKVLAGEEFDERSRHRFERECHAMGALSWHPNVAALHDSGITPGGVPYLAMEYLEGGSFGDRLRNGPLPWQEAVAVGVQIAGALDVAHAHGTLHRDLKPENLLVGPYGEAKLSDFGIAAVQGSKRTTTGHASFTVAHVAPEVLRGRRPDERSDQYGLASTLHMLIAGIAPFAHPDDDGDEAVATLILRVIESPTPRLDGVPPALADAVQRGLSKDPGARFGAVADFGRALQEVQRAAGVPITELRLAPGRASAPEGASAGDLSPTIPYGAPAPMPAPVEAPDPPELTSPPSRRSNGLLVGTLVAGALLIAAIAGAVVLLGGSDRADDADGGSAGGADAGAAGDEAAPFIGTWHNTDIDDSAQVITIEEAAGSTTTFDVIWQDNFAASVCPVVDGEADPYLGEGTIEAEPDDTSLTLELESFCLVDGPNDREHSAGTGTQPLEYDAEADQLVLPEFEDLPAQCFSRDAPGPSSCE